MKAEKNKSTLDRALANLPSHPAPDHIWSDLESELDRIKMYKELSSDQNQMTAPDHIWTQVEAHLDRTEIQDKPAEVGRSITFFRVAAAVLIFCFAAYYVINQNDTSYQYRTEIVYPVESSTDWLDVDQVFYDEIIDYIMQNQVLLLDGNNEMTRWWAELTELTKLCDQLKEEIHDPLLESNLARQLADMEMRKTELMKKIITII